MAPAADPPPAAEVHWLLAWWPIVLFILGAVGWAARRSVDYLVIGPRTEQKRLAAEVEKLTASVERACTVGDDQTKRLDRHSAELRSVSDRIDRLIEGLLER